MFLSIGEGLLVMKQRSGPRRLHRTPSAAKYLGLASHTLVQHRFRRTGPVYSKLGRVVIYDEDDLDSWVDDQRVDPAKKAA